MADTTASKGTIAAWSLFDFANTSFLVIVITVVFPVFFTEELADGNESYWTRAIAISMLVTALIGPVLGSIADATRRKKLFLGLFTGASIGATIGLYWMTGPSFLIVAMILLIVANVGFEGGTIFYDAFLPDIATPVDYARVSATGWAVGYAGSFLTLGLILPLLMGEPSQADARLTFLIAAGMFLVFALPMFFAVPEEGDVREREPGNPVVNGYRRLRETLTHLRSYRSVVRFLAAFFFYNDGILTVIALAAIFMNETLEFSMQQQIVFFMIVQATALIGALLFGRITNRIGPRMTIAVTLVIWIGVVLAAFFVTEATPFLIVGGFAGLALGSSQSTSRTMMALLTPEQKKTEFFGFYDGFFGKASAILGPLLFGEIAVALGQRRAMLVVGALFLIGLVLLFRVPDVRVGREAPR